MDVAGEGRKYKGLQEWRSSGSCGGGWLSVRASEVSVGFYSTVDDGVMLPSE